MTNMIAFDNITDMRAKEIIKKQLLSLTERFNTNSNYDLIKTAILNVIYSNLIPVKERLKLETKIVNTLLSVYPLQPPYVKSKTAAGICRFFRYTNPNTIPLRDFYSLSVYMRSWDCSENSDKYIERIVIILIMSLLKPKHLIINKHLYNFIETIDLKSMKYHNRPKVDVLIERDSYGVFNVLKKSFEKDFHVWGTNCVVPDDYEYFVGTVGTWSFYYVLKLCLFILDEENINIPEIAEFLDSILMYFKLNSSIMVDLP